ncbi:hypothetical protein GCM10010172_74100 [Paractinoplanes ferrugineus]|uniref:MFS transporter n=1 Tax=Paractinoplanes ferrugineus TaxID=113564 RepID=A0A919ME98_9ACTN|nr:hypothetical protein [Actinoplanes ferrugineus]GIE11434.1 hypothetical protein Afe05nite_32740 [Actinoplanes ferrugineus]
MVPDVADLRWIPGCELGDAGEEGGVGLRDAPFTGSGCCSPATGSALVGAAPTSWFTNRASWFTDRVGTARKVIIAAFVGVAGALIIPQGTGIAAYVAFAGGSLVFAGSSMVGSVTTRTHRMLASPPELLSRVIATVKFTSWGAIPIGSQLGGIRAGAIGARTTLLILGALTVLSPIIYLSTPSRRLRDLPSEATPELDSTGAR